MSKIYRLKGVNFLTIFFFLLSLVGFLLYFTKPTYQAEKIPGFNLNGFDGTLSRLENLRGQPIIMNFWAAWCEFCTVEMPLLENISKQYAEEGLIVLGIHRSETENMEDGKKFSDSIGITYKLIMDPNNRMFNYFGGGAQTVPITIFINRDGFVEEKIVGPRSEEEFRRIVERIL